MDTDPIARRHAKFRAPEGIVFGLVQRATGRRPTARTKISRGYDNEVYRVDTDGGGSVVVRIHRFGEIGPRQESWALERCLEAGVPVPQVLSVETVRLPDGEFDAMVQECVAGVPLNDVMREMSEAD